MPSPSIEATAPLASIIVRCKGRLEHLRQTMPFMLKQQVDFEYEVVVVDYGCPDGVASWCESLRDRRVVCAKVLENNDEFNRSRAQNCGARVARGKVLAFVDADVFIAPQWLDAAVQPIWSNQVGLVTITLGPEDSDLYGTCAISKDTFNRVRGFDESITGWGSEDYDFYSRCCQHVKQGWIARDLVRSIKHEDNDRTRFHRVKSKKQSTFSGMRYLRRRGETLEDLSYLQGKIEVVRCKP